MTSRYADQFAQQMEGKSTDELLDIWRINDREQWTEPVFDAISRVLADRGVAAPEQEVFAKANGKKKRGFLRSLFWDIDEDEVNKQVAEYDSLRITKSKRGQSFLLLIAAACLSLAGSFLVFHYIAPTVIVEVLFADLFLGYFVYKGQQWAMVASMVYCTIARLLLPIYGAMIGQSNTLLTHLIWWALFMNFFYTAFRVEQLRNRDKKHSQIKTEAQVESVGESTIRD